MTREYRWLQQQLDDPHTEINIVSGVGYGRCKFRKFHGRRTISGLRLAVKRATAAGDDAWAYVYIQTSDGHAYQVLFDPVMSWRLI